MLIDDGELRGMRLVGLEKIGEVTPPSARGLAITEIEENAQRVSKGQV